MSRELFPQKIYEDFNSNSRKKTVEDLGFARF